jgi:hypothetical protein
VALTFQRWDLIEPDGRPVSVLVLCEDGAPLSDIDHFDCFADTATAAEAAWLREGGPPPRGTWLGAADAAIERASEGRRHALGSPPARLVDTDMIAQEDVGWLLGREAGGLAETRSFERLPAATSGAEALSAFLEDDDAPLSGQMTQDWALADLAGLATTSPQAADDDALGTVGDGALSGRTTRDWKLGDYAAKVRKNDEDPDR